MTDQNIFDILLLSECLLPGYTAFKDSKTSISLNRESGETILFFNIDDNSNSNCKLRKFLWGSKQGESICDLLVFYAKGSDRVLCFVELKDNLADVGKATQQVINTYNSLKGHLKGQYTAKAFICASKGSAPIEQKKYQQELSKAFPEKKNGVSSNYGIDSPDKFSDFLRGVSSIGKGKGKKKRG